MATLVIHNPLSKQALEPIARDLRATITVKETHSTLETHFPISHSIRSALVKTLATDVNCLPETFNPDHAHLLVIDMDSTLISIECIDEIADFIGKKPAIAAITEAAMRGDIDFKKSLTQRVALLEGLDETVLEQVYNDRLTLNAGAETLIKGLRDRHISSALVSGGFTFFTERLKERLNLDYALANQLEINQGKLTGRVLGNIVDAAAKAEFLLNTCQQMSITPEQSIAVGDGANDLKMMGVAGLSVAYRAKPAVQTQAQTQINACSLDAILNLIDAKQP